MAYGKKPAIERQQVPQRGLLTFKDKRMEALVQVQGISEPDERDLPETVYRTE
jgi:hypothetical protein